jgi:N-acetylgalactosamine-N,N'-diacetylbacillosaminyl-diphospho-undecaprenol 4-alpha-N-acetylgalactosaminyltransferase
MPRRSLGAVRTEGAAHARPRIAFVINSLAGGGAERVFCRVIEGLRERLRACDSEIILLDEEIQAYPPPDFLSTRTLDSKRAMTASVSRLARELRRFQPDVAVSFLNRANCANIIAARICGHRTLISERVATSDHFGAGPGALLKRTVTRELYRRADALVAVSEGVKRGLVQSCGVPPARIEVIPNPVDVPQIRRLGAETPATPLPERYIVSANRLVPNKNVALQIEALHRSGLDHHLLILGDGPERCALAARAQALGLADRVRFLGFVANPFAIVARAQMYISTSNAEGFPNALAEAMALGVPCLSTNCASGPAEILADDPDLEIDTWRPAEFGVLTPVNDADACADALRFLSNQRRRYGERAATRVGVYAPERVTARYWQAIVRTAGPPAAHAGPN